MGRIFPYHTHTVKHHTQPITCTVSHETCGIHDTHGIYCKTNDNMFTKYLFDNLNVQQVPLPLRTAFHTHYYILKKYKVVTAPGAHAEEGVDR